MNRSLQRHLSKMLILAVIGCGILATLAAFYFAYSEAEEFQDDTLKQIAALSVGSHSESLRLERVDKSIEDPESRVQIARVPDGPNAEWLPGNIAPGFHTLPVQSGQEELRVFVRKLKNGKLVAVAQSTASRNEIAINSALRTLIPLLILIPILIWIIALIVRGEFGSITRLAEELDQQAADRPVSLPEDNIPLEITPFIQAINRLLQRVDQLISTQRRFIADAAHELRTPLTALSLQAQNLAEAKTADAMRERLEPLQEGIKRAHRLTIQLLDLARLQASEVSREIVDVPTLVRDVLAELYPLAEAKHIDIRMDDTGLKNIESVPRALTLIFRNGLENALKYTPAGGTVTIRLLQTTDNAAIEIEDNGPGLNNGDLENAFEPFYRLPNVTGEGSGLGLAIASEAATRIGGNLQLSNREDTHGAVFRYSQPLG